MAKIAASLKELASKKAGDADISKLLTPLFESTNNAECKGVVDYLNDDTVASSFAKQVYGVFSVLLSKLPNAGVIEVGEYAIENLEERAILFEVEDQKVRQLLADVFSARDMPDRAARVLTGINLNSTSRELTANEKCVIWLDIAEHWITDGNYADAETSINSMSYVTHHVTDQSLMFRFKMFQAAIYDIKRRYYQAASGFHALSTWTLSPVSEDESTNMLDNSVICTILCPAGPEKSRMLSSLYKDERSKRSQHYELMQKMFKGLIIQKEEVAKFSENLMEHHQSTGADGLTILERGLLEHNIVSISGIYENITFSELGRLLELDEYKAEILIATMVSESRVNATLDQTSRIVEFKSGEIMTRWDSQIVHLCNDLKQLLDDISKAEPKFESLIP